MSSASTLPKTRFELEFNQGSVYSDVDREAILRVFEANSPSCGGEVLAFEKEFAEFVHSTFAIAVGNATQGLEIAARAALASLAGQQPDRDEIIVPSVSWISTASGAALGGGQVKFADIVDPTICVNPDAIKRLVTPRTAAVMVVHLYGRSVDGLVELTAWLHERGIIVIEDCAHAVGAVDASGIPCGTIGDIGVFSFHQQKNMVTLGEGGMCVTSNPNLREKLVGFRSLCAMSYDPKGKYLAIDSTLHPMEQRYWLMDFADHGHNFRMLDMQAAVGRVQLQRVHQWNIRRAEIARMLYEGLQNVHIGLRVPEINHPKSDKWVHSWHIFHVLITTDFPLCKEQFMWSLLNEFGIKAWNHYSPMHLATSFRRHGQGKVGDCPVAEALFEQYVSLPIHPRLTSDAVQYMIDAIKQLAARPYVARTSAAPLLDALLSLTNVSYGKSSGGVDEQIVEDQLTQFRLQIKQAQQDGFFSVSSNDDVWITRAPGRLDLMGGNDDYTGGLVFECTISEATFVAVQVIAAENDNSNGQIVVRNRQLSEVDIYLPVSVMQQPSLTPDQLALQLRTIFPEESRWPLYVFGVLLWLQMKYPTEMFSQGRGLSILIWSEVPRNRGVSSSASVEVAVMKAAAFAFGVDLTGETLATACQWAENQVCSSACGLMDQMAVTLGTPFMAMKCQPAIIVTAPPLPSDLTVYALDSGVSHEVSGIEYEAARAAAFMGYKIICSIQGIDTVEETDGEIPRFTDAKYNGYLANMSPSEFARLFEKVLPESCLGTEFTTRYGAHVDPATSILPDHVYRIRANTKYAVLENNRVNKFYHLLRGCNSLDTAEQRNQVYIELGELMYQSHDAYTECGLGSTATSRIVDLVQSLGPASGLFGAKITGGGAGGTVTVLGLHSAASTFKTCVVEAYASQSGFVEPPFVFVGSSPGADAFGVRKLNS